MNETPIEKTPDFVSDVSQRQEKSQYQLYFGNEENELDAATLGSVLLNTVTLTEEANAELKTGQQLEIKVKSHREGSFIVDIAFEAKKTLEPLIPMLTPTNLEIIKTSVEAIVALITGVYSLRKALKEEKPQSIQIGDNNNEVLIITGNNNKITTNRKVFNLYFENPRAQDAVNQTFKTLSKDETVTDFAVLDKKNNPLFEANREDFKALSESVTIEDAKKEVSEITSLYIIKPSFDSELTWSFMHRGYKISAYVKDPEFLGRIDKGEPFAKGDVLEVELKIEQEFNYSVNTYENKKYIVSRVLRHIPRERQYEFDLKEN